MKVLVVDDSKAMRMIISRELRKAGLDDIAEAESADAAIDFLHHTWADFVLSDWNMPGTNGFDFLKRLKAGGWQGKLGFITSESAEETREAALAAGAEFFVTKPFKQGELADRLTSAATGAVVASEDDGAPERDAGAEVGAVLEGMLGKAVRVGEARELPARDIARVVARYVDLRGAPAAVVVAAASFAAAAGAALAMMPAAEAKLWVDSGALNDALEQNFHEVANVLARVVGAPLGGCTLQEMVVYDDLERLPDAQRIDEAPHQEHFDVEIQGYGRGQLSLVQLIAS